MAKEAISDTHDKGLIWTVLNSSLLEVFEATSSD